MKWIRLFGCYQPQLKCEPLTAAALGTAVAPAIVNTVGSLASSLIGQSSQKAENDKQRAWEEKMWLMNNEYNTPLAQRKRLEDAGYNPYLLSDDSSASGQSTLPSAPAASPLPQFHNPLDGSAQILQQGLQVEANVDLQRMKTLESVSDIMLKLYKDGGQKQVNEFMQEFAPALKALNFEGSFYEQRIKKEFLSMDIANDRADIQRMVENLYSKDTANQILDNLRKTYDLMSSQIDSLEAETNVSKARLNEIASNIARNFAEAFNARKVGEYYEVSSDQMSIINKMLDMDEQEREADFSFNTGVRKYKKDITHRGVALGLFTGSIGAQNTSLDVQGNKFIQYGKEVSNMIGNVFKVNFGLSSNKTNFHNRTPNDNGRMFYSGDGYYMNNGLLMKGNW